MISNASPKRSNFCIGIDLETMNCLTLAMCTMPETNLYNPDTRVIRNLLH